ncbi:MAG: cobyrinate a,c-diamide synthase [Eubacterium sp.]|nr:cobyrinate a,c-diamide synthase [Eubacterium sp.]
MKQKRVMIAAPKSGSGKTVVTCAFLAACRQRGLQAVSFKCGPDYIDPMFHEKMLHIPSKNLDTFFTGEEKTKALFAEDAGTKDIAVIEGVMGLYDGLGGVREEGSSYHLAKVTKTPVVLVVDAKGTGRTILSMIAGLLAYDREHLIQGVIFNRASKGYFETIKPLAREELKIAALGFLPEQKALHIESRHLGLLLPKEVQSLEEKLTAAAEAFAQTVCVERMLQIAEHADTQAYAQAACTRRMLQMEDAPYISRLAGRDKPVIAVAKDEAFCFYYADNIKLLQAYGAKITYFSPIWDDKLPDNCHALLLGGGYPELYAKQLSRNMTMRQSVRQAAADKMPIVAECGGFLYLHSALQDQDGNCYEMAGAVPAACFYTGKLVRFGYVALREKQSFFLPAGGTIKGHEYHYYDSAKNGTDAVAVKPATGKEYPCVIENEMQWMGFPHLYYPSNPCFAKAFLEKALRYSGRSH